MPTDQISSVRSAYLPHERIQVDNFGPSMAKQSMAAECDINNIMKKYEKSGMIDHIIRYKGQYADVAQAMDYQEAIHTIMEAETMFSTLPASVRDKFNNNPRDFLDFVENPENREEMEALGLLDKPPGSAEEPAKAGLEPAETPE